MILHNGILGKGTKKIGNVVGANWKDKNYVRSYVIPANPNTILQQAQRSKFSKCVSFVLGILGQIINVYVSPYMKGMSGYNYFIKKNVSLFGETIEWANIYLTWGQLFPPQLKSALYEGTTGNVRVSWYTTTGNNGKSTDIVEAAVYDANDGKWYFNTPTSVRSDAGTDVMTALELDSSTMHAWAWARQMDGTKIKLLSNSQPWQVTDAP